jgi:hypothetical protein
MVEFRIQNLYETDLSQADVLSMYLLHEINYRLRPRILDTMRPGTRVVSHAFDMDDWKPDQEERIGPRRAFLWIVPAKVQGQWQFEARETKLTLDFDQEYQRIRGSAAVSGRTLPLRDARLRGEDISFTLDIDGVTRIFTGRVNGDTIENRESGAGAWKATRSRGP